MSQFFLGLTAYVCLHSISHSFIKIVIEQLIYTQIGTGDNNSQISSVKSAKTSKAKNISEHETKVPYDFD